ncbi:MAG TPA: tetratricopeptide repeat protein, partial [Longimicrobium sp.]|nr:tetratricopeptide repeat protein [Longimicrobium sp.]
LFIIDNVPEPQPDQPPKPLDTWCPVLGDVPVLTTSRTRVALGGGGSVVALPIDTLDPDAAVELLATQVRRDQLDDTEWKHIAEWVGHLPLALEVLNRLLRSGEMTPRALLNMSRQERPSAAVDAATDILEPVLPRGALRGITQAFSASYKLLTAEERYAVRLIAWMAPEPVPTFVINAFGPGVFPPGVRAKLRNRSFVTEVRDGAGDFFGLMHRVLADFLRVQSKEPKNEAETVAALLTGLLTSAEGQGAEGSILVFRSVPLAIAVFRNWIAEPLSGTALFGACDFMNRTGSTAVKWGYPALARDAFRLLVAVSADGFGATDLNTLGAMNNLALTLRRLGEPAEARKLQDQIIDARKRLLGDEHPDTLAAMNNLAGTLHQQGDHGSAWQLQERVVKSLRRVLGDEHPSTLSAMDNLAVTRRGRGDLAGAQELHERSLKVMERVLGNEHLDTLMAMFNLAVTLHHRGDLAAAQELHERTLRVTRHHLGREHPLATITAHELLKIHITRKDLGAARLLFQEALLWLMHRERASLPEDQRHVQDELRSIHLPADPV